MIFNSKCLLFNKNTGNFTEVVVNSIQDIIEIVGGGVKTDVTQVNIDKYHKIYYNSSEASMVNGVSGWITLKEEYDEMTGNWISCKNKDYFTGDEILLVLCDDKKPINITDEAKEFMISCINY